MNIASIVIYYIASIFLHSATCIWLASPHLLDPATTVCDSALQILLVKLIRGRKLFADQ